MNSKLIFVFASGVLLSACGGSSNNNSNNVEQPIAMEEPIQQSVVYQVTYNSNWTSANFPTKYPANAHYSPFTGLTHNEQGRIFKSGELASAGIVLMAETGSRGVLSNEISEIQNMGNSRYLIAEGGIPSNDNTVSFTFEASTDYPLLSLVSMIAPSPDWFIGIDSMPLIENNAWITNRTLAVKVYDAGSDDGATFATANLPSTPRQLIELLSTPNSETDFNQGVHVQTEQSIGTMTIELVSQ